ncbi:hypothetical protein [Amphibiibacter pelophylacis]|uniref:Uncharacterized protein n=1 Tax=Amphibiibacter pelophylacis TaxID=1799477 RepID=A0ACC6P1V8_9BURK
MKRLTLSLLASALLAACAQNSVLPPFPAQPGQPGQAGQPGTTPDGSNAGGAPPDPLPSITRVALRNVALGFALGRYQEETDFDAQNLIVHEVSNDITFTGKAWVFGKVMLEDHTGQCKAVGDDKRITTIGCVPGSQRQQFAFIPSTTGAVQLYSVSENRCVNAITETESSARFGLVDCVADLANPLQEVPALQLWQINPELGSDQVLLEAPF